MKIIEGQFNTAKVFTDVIDDGAVEQIKKLYDQKYTADSVRFTVNGIKKY